MVNNQVPLIETSGLSCGFAEKVLFKNLDLALNAGELICFMGPNGSGKSTLIKTLCGILKPLAGTIIYNGHSIIKEHLLSVVLTDPIRASYMTIYDLVVFGRYPYLNWQIKLTDKDKALIDDSIEKVNLSHLRHFTLDKLSDGQKQMAMIARALAQDTPVIILDEPTAHLDLNNRVEIMRLLKNLTRSLNKSILLATHELDLALQTADLIWLAGDNNTIISGVPEDLVLRGIFDDIFKFKGFDLKTGKVQHPVSREATIQLVGEGHEYLWTRNLLERNGFMVTSEKTNFTLGVKQNAGGMEWTLNESRVFRSLTELQVFLEDL